MKPLIRLSLALFVLLLSACGPTGDTEGLKQNIVKNKFNISSLIIKPRDTQTLDPVTSPPANPKYYFAHSDSEELQAFGMTDTGDEIALTDLDLTWSITDNSDTSGDTTIDKNGLLKTETLQANQTKEISVNISFASLQASANVIISSYPLATGGLSIKIDDAVINGTTQDVVVCDTTSLTAEGLFDDGSTRDITRKITWADSINDSNARFTTTDTHYAVFSSHTIATYTVTPDYKGQGSATVDLDVTETNTKFSNFTLSPSSVSLATKESYQLSAQADIDDGSGKVNKNVSSQAKWSSANTAIFKVDDAGVVEGVTEGGPLAATAECGSATVTSNITVSDENAVQSIEILDENSNTIDEYKELSISSGTGESVNLKLRAYLLDETEVDITTDENTTWEVTFLPGEGEPIKINNTDDKGLVTAIAVGIAKVVAKYKGYEHKLVVIVSSN